MPKNKNSKTDVQCPHCGKRLYPNGREIRTWRLGAGLSQNAFAKLVGITPSYVAYLESGERRPSLELVARLERLMKRRKRAGR